MYACTYIHVLGHLSCAYVMHVFMFVHTRACIHACMCGWMHAVSGRVGECVDEIILKIHQHVLQPNNKTKSKEWT